MTEIHQDGKTIVSFISAEDGQHHVGIVQQRIIDFDDKDADGMAKCILVIHCEDGVERRHSGETWKWKGSIPSKEQWAQIQAAKPMDSLDNIHDYWRSSTHS